MGGGTSGLFFGTKGAKHDYQYSLFPDLIRKDKTEFTEGVGSTGLQNSNEPKTRSKKRLITVDILLQKCLEYHAGKISAQQLVDWLFFITMATTYWIESHLKTTIVNAAYSLSSCLCNNDILEFNRELIKFENQLKLLQK